MVCSGQCLMCSMSVQVHMQVHLHLQVLCVVYTVQCVMCRVQCAVCRVSVLPAKDEDLAVETG